MADGTTVLVSGASGFLGRALCAQLRREGYRVRSLQRPGRELDADAVAWDPLAAGRLPLDPADLADAHALVHLAGENIAAGRWTSARKRRLRDSRVVATQGLARVLASLGERAPLWVSASAVGYYGDRGDAPCTEEAPPGDDFLARLCVDWEAATEEARRAGVRVACARFGPIFGPGGGPLARLLPVFRAGLGGRLGSGRQVMSWVALQDAVSALSFALGTGRLRGPFNVTAPEPVTNAELTRALARTVGRPAWLPVPSFAARLAFGELADAALLGGVRAPPAALERAGFRFRYPTLGPLLRDLCARS